MRIVATADTHFEFSPDQIPDGDVLIHAGDLMYGGGPDEWPSRLASLAALPHPTKLYIPGNHDFHMELYQGVAVAELRRAGIRPLGLTPERAMIQIEDVKILGLPWVPNLPGWAFNRDETWIADYLDAVVEAYGYPDIVVSHSPMYSVLDAIAPGIPDYHRQQHVGCMAYNKWFNQDQTKRPKIWISGHIHESYGRTGKDGCTFFNVAMCDRDYEQSNNPMIIEV